LFSVWTIIYRTRKPANFYVT